MFDFNSFREIVSTIRKNKMRTFLTGFAVAWGVFMLIVLLASGNGLRNGTMANFGDRSKNAVTIWPGWTSMPYAGLSPGRNIKFDQKDYDLLKNKIPEIKYISASNGTTAMTISYGKEYGSWELEGASQYSPYINNVHIPAGQGRFINQLDINNKRKVAVINTEMRNILFKGDDPLGKYIIANNIAFRVIGVYDNKTQYSNNPPVYIPYTTAQTIYNQGDGFWWIEFTVKGLSTLEENEAFNQRLREKLGQLHGFDPNDRAALYIWNTAEQAIEAEKFLNLINVFILIVGIASLMAGIVGVGNIMLITVKERTREIGIRKAIGATPFSILELIILEAIFITTCAGYLGIVLGVGITELVGSMMSSGGGGGTSVFLDPTVNLGTVIGATALLVVCGVIAGLIPALKAIKVRPIEAMRAE